MNHGRWLLLLISACGGEGNDATSFDASSGSTSTVSTTSTPSTAGTATTQPDTSGDPGASTSGSGGGVTSSSSGGPDTEGPTTGAQGSSTTSSTGGSQSAGCDMPVQTGYQCFDEVFEGVARRWCAFVPEFYDAAASHSVMLGLHGCGGSPEGVHGGAAAPQEAYAGDDYVFVYPAAAASCWEYNLPSDAAYIAFVIEQVAQRYCIDKSRIFAHGMSSGAMMASRVLCDGIVAGAAAISLNFSCGQAHPIWLFGGTSDEYYAQYIIPGRDGWIAANGCTGDTVPLGDGPCVEYQGCTHRTVWCSDDRGHVWPTEPWAAEGIMDFFGTLPGLE